MTSIQRLAPRLISARWSRLATHSSSAAHQWQTTDKSRNFHNSNRRLAQVDRGVSNPASNNEVDINAIDEAAEASEAGVVQEGVDEREEMDEKQYLENIRERDPSYYPAMTMDGLEWVGSDSWLAKKLDSGRQFEGWGRRDRVRITRGNAQGLADLVAAEAFRGEQGVTKETSVTSAESRIKIAEVMATTLGIRPSDRLLQGVRTVGDLRNALLGARQPEKFTVKLKHSTPLGAMPNVQMRTRRQRKEDEDEKRGRAKLIVQALNERGLPIRRQDATQKRRLI